MPPRTGGGTEENAQGLPGRVVPRWAYQIRVRASVWLLKRVVHLRSLFRSLAQQQMEHALDNAHDSAAAHLRSQLKDDAMPQLVQRSIDQMMDSLMPDIKQECWRWTDEHFLPPKASPHPARETFSPLSPRRSRLSAVPGCGTPQSGDRLRTAEDRLSPSNWLSRRHAGCVLTLRRIRATVLHTLWPHDRSVWSCARTPSWWALQVVGVLPYLAGLWWILLHAAVDKGDEYQLCQFIVAVRTSHFLTVRRRRRRSRRGLYHHRYRATTAAVP